MRQPSTRTGAAATLAATSTSATASVKSDSFEVSSTTIVSMPPGAVHHIMECEDRDRHDVKNRRRAQYEADYGHPEVPIPNQDRQPRS
jgi:hypothetical protein